MSADQDIVGVSHSQPQSAADRLRTETKSSSMDERFLRWFLLVFLAVIVIGVTTSYVVNPYGRFAPAVYAPRAPLVRDEKVQLWRAARDPRIVVVGSSRVKKLDPSCITKLTGMSAFNFGVDGGSLDDLRAIVSLLLESANPPSQIVIGLDSGMFSSIKGVARATMWSRSLAGQLDVSLEDRVNAYGEMLWSQSALVDDAAVLARGRARQHSHQHRADGFLETPNEDVARRQGAYDLAPHLKESSARLFPIYVASNVDPRRVRVFRDLLRDAHDRGIHVLAFTPPIHPSLEQSLAADPNIRATTIAFRSAIADLAADGLLDNVASELADFGGSPENFLDADHMDEVNASRLVGHLYKRPDGCAVQ